MGILVPTCRGLGNAHNVSTHFYGPEPVNKDLFFFLIFSLCFPFQVFQVLPDRSDRRPSRMGHSLSKMQNKPNPYMRQNES
jgi:hypothetical protein